jgi:hypothetical protein
VRFNPDWGLRPAEGFCRLRSELLFLMVFCFFLTKTNCNSDHEESGRCGDVTPAPLVWASNSRVIFYDHALDAL